MEKYIYISPSDKEERMINVAQIREIYRVKDMIGYTFLDGETSTAKMASVEEAEEAWKQIHDIMNPPVIAPYIPQNQDFLGNTEPLNPMYPHNHILI